MNWKFWRTKGRNLFDNFKDWVCEQDEVHPINHEGWEYCAIGRFAKSINKDYKEVLDVIRPEEPYIVACLTSASAAEEDDDSLETYGGLCEYIGIHQGDDIEKYLSDSAWIRE